MGRGGDALNRGQDSLLDEHGELAYVDDECVTCLIDRNPRLKNQAKNQVDLAQGEFSRVQVERNEYSGTLKSGMEFVDRSGNRHRIRTVEVVDNNYICECVVQKAE